MGVPVVNPGLLLEDGLVRDIFIFSGEIDERVDAGFEQRVEPLARLLRVEEARVFACQEAARLDPVGFREGKAVVTHLFA